MQSADHYIDGAWIHSDGGTRHDVINPATARPCATVTFGTAVDVDRAVTAARRAFDDFSRTDMATRIALLEAIVTGYKARAEDIAQAIATEMGCPIAIARTAQVGSGIGHLKSAIKALREISLQERVGNSLVVHEPIGVVALITPWNWPMNQILAKVAPALAAGNAMILKPSEQAPTCAAILAQVIHDAGVPAGVFNLVQGDGAGVGTALATHPGIDMISFTGSTRAGIAVAKSAADTVKRVHQELGGKSPSIVLDSADFSRAVPATIMSVLLNSGQSCIAPTRLLVPRDRHDEAVAIAAKVFGEASIGDPMTVGRHIGPVVNRSQWEKIQRLLETAAAEGTRLVTGGPGRPDGAGDGYYVRPTLFADVDNTMTIAREEVFGPVVTIIPYEDEDDAVRIANDTEYGLSAVVHGAPDDVRRVVPRLRAGMVYVNGGAPDPDVPFGGYKQSGNGREYGRYGLREFMEIKSVIGAFA